MKKMIVSSLLFSLLAVQSGAAMLYAAEGAPAVDPAAQQAALDQKKAELNGNEWDIKVTPSGAKEAGKTDTISFKDKKFNSKLMSEEGYAPTNYTLTLQEGGPTVFETMQSSDKGPVVFWRGEWEGESVHGVMSKQIGEGKNEDYFFSGTANRKIEDTPAPAAPAAAAPAEEVKSEVPVMPAVDTAVVETQAVSATNAALDTMPSEPVKDLSDVAANTQAAAPAQEESASAKGKKKGWF